MDALGQGQVRARAALAAALLHRLAVALAVEDNAIPTLDKLPDALAGCRLDSEATARFKISAIEAVIVSFGEQIVDGEHHAILRCEPAGFKPAATVVLRAEVERPDALQ